MKQLKNKVKKWGLDTKNIKTGDMIAIARTRAKRKRGEGKDSEFRAYGAPLDEAKIDRFMKRNKLSTDVLLSAPSPVNGQSST